MKALSTDSFLARLLAKLAATVCRHPGWFFWPQILLFVACIFYTVFSLQFDTSRDDLVGSNKKYQQNYLNFKKEFPEQSDLVVVIQSENIEKNRQFAERIGAKLEAETNLFTDVFYKGDLPMMGAKALLFVPENDLGNLKKTLQDDAPFIRQFTQTTNLISLFERINTAFRTAPRETNAQTESLIQSLPALTRIVTQADASLNQPGTPPSPGVMALFDAGGEAVRKTYITFANGEIFLVTAHAPVHELNGKAVERVRQLIQEIQSEVPGLNVGLTGEPVIEHDEMEQSQKDTTLASIVALILCALIFIYGYSETGRPVKATICLVIGLAYTLAFATLTVGHLNILTITFVPILIGLAIDFGVHLVTRYEEELRKGKTKEEALTKAMVFTGQGIFVGALTTAGAFLAMWFTNFKGIQEMGIICGGGLLVCFIPMITLLPVLLLRGRQNVMDHKTDAVERRARIENIWLQRPVVVTVIVVALCALALPQARKVYFDYNLLNMESAGMPAVVFVQKLIHSADKSVIYGAVVADSLAQAVELQKQIEKLPTVASNGVQSMALFLNEDQTKKLKLVSQIKQEVAPLKFNAPDLQPLNLENFSSTLYSLYGYLGAALDEIKDSNPSLTAQLTALREAIDNLRKEMLDGDATARAEHADKLAEFQRAFFADARQTFQTLQNQDDRASLHVEDLPPALRHRFVGVSGKFLLQVYPKYDVWQHDNQEKFIADLRTIDPNVTGTPVQLYEYTTLLKNSYETAAWYSLIAIAILVFVHFRSLNAVILSLLPVGIGTLWLVGLMGWLKIPFNPANIMTLPLVIGIGVTNGIHILNRFAEERTPGILSRSTGKAVLVSGLTAIAGFGSLMLAKHRGIHSLGCVMATGIATCMIAALAFLPALLNLLGRRKPLIEKPDVSRTSPTPGQEEPR
jgi:hopanoid biosynthesis associated RND transporter like protein HpnN